MLQALTTEEAAPDSVLESARELAHVLVAQPRTWATGGLAAPRYLVRLTAPAAWSNDRAFGEHVVPVITEAIAATEPDPTRLRREPHCAVQIVGLREHCLGALGLPMSSTEITRLMTRGFRNSDDRPQAPAGSTIDPVCGMAVEWATARVYAEDHGLA